MEMLIFRNPVTEHYLLEMIDRSRWRKPQEDFHQVL